MTAAVHCRHQQLDVQLYLDVIKPLLLLDTLPSRFWHRLSLRVTAIVDTNLLLNFNYNLFIKEVRLFSEVEFNGTSLNHCKVK